MREKAKGLFWMLDDFCAQKWMGYFLCVCCMWWAQFQPRLPHVICQDAELMRQHTCAIPIDFEPISILESKIFDTFGIVLILVLKRTPLGYWYWYWFWNSFCWVLVLVLVLKQLLLGFGFGIGFETCFCWVLVLILVLNLVLCIGFDIEKWFLESRLILDICSLEETLQNTQDAKTF